MQGNLLLQYLGILTISKWLHNKRIRQNIVINKQAKYFCVKTTIRKNVYGAFI